MTTSERKAAAIAKKLVSALIQFEQFNDDPELILDELYMQPLDALPFTQQNEVKQILGLIQDFILDAKFGGSTCGQSKMS